MLFKFIGTYALLALLTRAGDDPCDGQDMLWSDFADNSTIATAFSQVCSKLTVDSDGNFKVDGCVDVGEKHIDAKVDFCTDFNVTEILNDTVRACEGLLDIVRVTCEKGGSLHLGSDFFDVGGDFNFSAYPKMHNC